VKETRRAEEYSQRRIMREATARERGREAVEEKSSAVRKVKNNVAESHVPSGF
jgi:hypothetical protein